MQITFTNCREEYVEMKFEMNKDVVVRPLRNTARKYVVKHEDDILNIKLLMFYCSAIAPEPLLSAHVLVGRYANRLNVGTNCMNSRLTFDETVSRAVVPSLYAGSVNPKAYAKCCLQFAFDERLAKVIKDKKYKVRAQLCEGSQTLVHAYQESLEQGESLTENEWFQVHVLGKIFGPRITNILSLSEYRRKAFDTNSMYRHLYRDTKKTFLNEVDRNVTRQLKELRNDGKIYINLSVADLSLTVPRDVVDNAINIIRRAKGFRPLQ